MFITTTITINNANPWPILEKSKTFVNDSICTAFVLVYITSNSCDIRHFLDIPFICFIDFITHIRHIKRTFFIILHVFLFQFCFVGFFGMQIELIECPMGEKLKIFAASSVRILSFKNTINITFDCLSLRSMVWHCVLTVKMRAHWLILLQLRKRSTIRPRFDRYRSMKIIKRMKRIRATVPVI